jgi:cytochrome c biogenesis protein ResB
MWLALALMALLIILSVYGAFIGAERAGELFNSLPMQMFWFLITAGLVASLILFTSLFKHPSLLLIHLGCIGILAGSIQASQTGHKIQMRLFGIDKIRSGVMVINEGKMNDEVVVPAKSRFIGVELPFHIGLKDYRVEYYDTPGPDGRRAVRDYLSNVSVIQDGRIVKTKTIEVNRPLHYGGYYFYLRPPEETRGEQMVLAVISDNGLIAVFTGYVFLAAGLFGRCWLRPLIKKDN